MLWKRIEHQENGNAIFILFSPTTLEYFLYFEKAAIKLFSLPTFSFHSGTVSYKLANRPHGHSEPHAQAQSTELHQLQVRQSHTGLHQHLLSNHTSFGLGNPPVAHCL